MKHIISRFAGLAMVSVLGLGSAYAVPARPQPVEVEQPDGTKVTLTLRGDEYFHYYQTTDGYVVKDMSDGWYRIVDNAGEPTDMPALNVGDRDAGYVSRLSSVNGAVAFDNFRNKVEKASNRTDYRLQRTSPARISSRANASDAKWDNADRHYLREFPAEGTQKVLVILVSYSDKSWSYCDDPQTEMQAMLQQPGYSKYDCTGSAFDYFKESSRNIFRPSFDVYGPVKLPQRMSYYGGNDYYGNDQHPEQMVIHACQILDGEIDFSEYDRDGDGVVDNIYVFYAGYGENEGGDSSTVWPHSWDVRYAGGGDTEFDGVKIGHYACSNELTRNGNTISGIGTFCHEFSHVLGLPDLYATSYTSSHTPGEYSLMDHGSYNNNSRTPPIYSGYERYALEWQAPVVISKDEDIHTRALTDGGNFYKMTIDPGKPTEYYLFENRQPIGNDVTLPAHGMLIWRIDHQQSKWDNNTVNNTPTDQCVDIIEADGRPSDADMDGDTFPGINNVTEFTASTNPAFQNKSGKKSALGLTRISENVDGVVSFRVGEGMNEDSDYPCETPYSEVAGIGSDSFTINFKHNNGASFDKGGGGEVFVVSVESMTYDEEEETFLSQPLEGYTLKRVASGSDFVVKGVSPLTNYRVNTYRETSANMSEPFVVNVLTGGEAVADSRTELSVSNVKGNDADLNWIPVEGADHYLVTVATRKNGASYDNVEVDFSGSPRVPEGWQTMGVFSSQAGNYGKAAPSFYISYSTDYLWTSQYPENDIESVEFWCRKSADKPIGLNIFSVTPTGSLSLLASVDEISKTGGKVTVDFDAQNVHGLVFMLKNSDSTRIYIDDIQINFRDAYEDTPVGAYDDMAVDADKVNVSGLDLNTSYVAYVKTHDGSKAGVKSNTVEFTTTNESGVDSVVGEGKSAGFYVANGVIRCSDASAEFDILAIDGTTVALGAKGACQLPSRGVYVVRFGGKSVKVIY